MRTSSYWLAFLMSVALVGCASMAMPQYGVQDDIAAKAIRRINNLVELRSSLRYEELLSSLEADAIRFSKSAYAYPRILNEMAELYSLQILDLESAISIDEQLLRMEIVSQDTGDFRPRHQTASQYTIADSSYVSSFVTVEGGLIKKRASERLLVNRRLITGGQTEGSKTYTVERLTQHLHQVQEDVESTPPNSTARQRILSRLIRGEYELSRIRPTTVLKAYQEIDRGQLSLNTVDLSEIDYLSLADYFVRVFKQTGNISYAEYALKTVYRPYIKLRNPNYRWQYNKLINSYITMLIDANYQAGKYDNMLYYSSLNKSRMLLEERLTYSGKQSASNRLLDLAEDDGIPRDKYGLPDKAWFVNKLAATDRLLDIYVGGSYVAARSTRGQEAKRYGDASAMPLTSRNVGVVTEAGGEEVFADDSMYFTYISNGQPSVRKVSGRQLEKIREELKSSYESIDTAKLLPARSAPSFSYLGETLGLPTEFTVSPDKWLSKHPMDYHFNAKTVRTVNLFMQTDRGRLKDIRIAGFFNPKLTDPRGDLIGADQEADVIKKLDPAAIIVRREYAGLSALKNVSGANIVHLSMHGSFDQKSPLRSKLYFAGAKYGVIADDPYALYAEDMVKYEGLRDRDLIFAAACQTGLSKADTANESEQTGMIRPLTANRNHNVILSLWSVDDAATKYFVEAFYEKLIGTKDVTEAFYYAQDEVRKKYPHPKYWAAFYLSKS